MSPEEATLFTAALSAASGLLGAVIGGVSAYLITKQQVKANVLSTSREKWITELRHHLAEFSSLSTLVSTSLRTGAGDDDAFRANHERMFFLADLLDLQLNHENPLHDRLLAAIRSVVGAVEERPGPTAEKDLAAEQLRLSREARMVIKAEWNKVKKGT